MAAEGWKSNHLSPEALRKYEETLKSPFRRALESGRVDLLDPPAPGDRKAEETDLPTRAAARGKAVFDESSGRLLLPLYSGGRCIGVLAIYGVEAGQLTQQVRPFLAALVETALEMVRLRQTSERDPLTGLANEEALEDELTTLVSRLTPHARRRERPSLAPEEEGRGLCLLALEAEGLGAAQTRFGRRFGQKALVEMSRGLREAAPEALSAARLGRIFLVLLEGGEDSASRTAGRLVKRLSKVDVPIAGNQTWRVRPRLGAVLLEPGLGGGQPAAEAAALLKTRALRALTCSARLEPGEVLFYSRILDKAGRVAEVRPLNQVLINLGRADGLAEGERFAALAPGGGDPKAELVVTRVGDEESLAEVTTLHEPTSGVRPGDRLAPAAKGRALSLEPGPEVEVNLGRRKVLALVEESTGLVRRRGFMSLLAELAAEGEPFAAVMVRVEGLEGAREVLGQEGVESMMRALAQAAAEAAPSGTLLGRFGPDTLAALLPGLGESEALSVARNLLERLRREMERTVRAGLAIHPTPGMKAEETLDNAAKALIHAGFLEPFSVVPFDAVSLNISGDRLFDQGRLTEAVAEYERALILCPEETNVLNSLGVSYGHLGQMDRAMRLFERAQKTAPDDFMAYYNLGCVYLTTGRRDLARQRLKESLERNPGHADTLFQLGQVEQEDGRLTQALDLLRQAAGTPGCRKAVHRRLGEVHTGLGRLSEAEDAFNRAVRENPRDASALTGLAKLYLDRGANREIALSLARRAAQLEPGEPRHTLVLARALKETGETGEAVRLLQEAAAESPLDAYLALALGRLEAERGRKAAARGWYAKALELEPSLEEAAREMEELSPEGEAPEE